MRHVSKWFCMYAYDYRTITLSANKVSEMTGTTVTDNDMFLAAIIRSYESTNFLNNYRTYYSGVVI